MAGHTHRCALCDAPIRCNGYRVDNYDGFPPVLCSVEADMAPGDVFLCEGCVDLADDAIAEAQKGAA